MPLETLIYVVGLVLTAVALGGVAFLAVGELRVRALRRSRLAGAGAAVAGSGDPLVERPNGAFAEQLLSTVRRARACTRLTFSSSSSTKSTTIPSTASALQAFDPQPCLTAFSQA